MRDKFFLLLMSTLGLSVVAVAAPVWLLSLATVAAGTGLVVLGLLVLWRSGLVPFGQALYFATGAYSVALAVRAGLTTDAFLLLIIASISSGTLAAVAGCLLSRYREIFFAMLSLALSMILYGVLVQSQYFGSTDGIHVGTATFLTAAPTSSSYVTLLFLLAWVLTVFAARGITWFLKSVAGNLSGLIRQNEVRIEYMRFSVGKLVHLNLIIAGVLAGAGGGLTALSIGHVDPSFAYWTTSGEFVFVTILVGTTSVPGAIIGSFLFVLLRSTAMSLVPEAWQLILGSVLLLTILFMPQGIGALVVRMFRRRVQS
ncbi:branched-chain amino acid ABC transporter permease [Ensifer adhaerens]|uniref:branched-chain amino acid ABC transporter permease n=1 Tax=Ensifer adhaerens TaxID=106592 RepID=UPI001CBBAD9A|nr:branched-chain amino acid ABC transporter permease [Ensifer adhaerens]MBZ7924304.1 branched-chain amino acid ABC transporter permease [Ensifer adhaerens]UAX96445.1 branched-chain amino acid ABC transporter permease [Ensifer adhaerens]UAY04212.1 branched-chain amino acid ABC transporter permease [Ensifer adhaerens]UAY12198.1 branched-chain amino acid ABC transporter permease [Ensifer adhaerens]